VQELCRIVQDFSIFEEYFLGFEKHASGRQSRAHRRSLAVRSDAFYLAFVNTFSHISSSIFSRDVARTRGDNAATALPARV
jgi:hypothetical protein